MHANSTARGAEAVLDLLEHTLAGRTGWDERPGLYVIHRRAADLKLTELRIPHRMWVDIPTALVPAHLARTRLVRLQTRNLVAVALRCEQYRVDSTNPQGAEVIRLGRLGLPTPSLANVKGRVEERGITAVGPDGDSYMVWAKRNPDDSAGEVTRMHIGPTASPGTRWSGRIIDGRGRQIHQPV